MIRNQKAFGSGVVFIAIGVLFLVVGSEYRSGTASNMGPGYFPSLVSILLILVGLSTAARSLLGTGEKVDPVALRPLIAIVAATVVFGFLVRGAGMIPAVIAAVCVGAFGSSRLTILSTICLAIALAVFSWLVFSVGLRLPVPAFGPWFRAWPFGIGG